MSLSLPMYGFPTRLTSRAGLPIKHAELHAHEGHEWFYCTAGAGTQVTPEGYHPTRRGDLFLFPAGLAHCCHVAEVQEECSCLVVNIHSSILPSEVETLAECRAILDALTAHCFVEGPRVTPSRAGRRAVGELMEAMVRECCEQRAGHRAALAALYQQLLLRLLRDPDLAPILSNAVKPSSRTARLAGVLQFLRLHFREQITVDQAAAMACLSRSHFHAVFKEATGQTFVEYLSQLRIAEAERLLVETDWPILEISAECGFNTLSHFYQTMRARTGRTPRQVRLTG